MLPCLIAICTQALGHSIAPCHSLLPLRLFTSDAAVPSPANHTLTAKGVACETIVCSLAQTSLPRSAPQKKLTPALLVQRSAK